MTTTEKPRRTERKPQRPNQLASIQVMFAAILAIGLILAINFSSRIAAGQPLQRAHERVVEEIEQLRKEQARLIIERDYVRSDAYVEAWARNEGKMVRPGEILVIPVPSGALMEVTPEAESSVPIQTTPPEPEPWMVWWSLFFDSPPPEF